MLTGVLLHEIKPAVPVHMTGDPGADGKLTGRPNGDQAVQHRQQVGPPGQTSGTPVAGMDSVLVSPQMVQVKVLTPVSVSVGSFVTLPLSHA